VRRHQQAHHQRIGFADLLEQIDYKQVKRIQFDGETIWVPAEQ